jgi:uncharacterized membrane protein YhiD involved in acid resistance
MLLEEVSAISIGRLVAAVFVACIAGLLICVVYRVTYGGVLFNKQFLLGLVLMSMITATIILTISSNLVLSLGMVGALSIVRFRTAVKEPMDTIFMFWSLAAGILAGAGFLLIAILATLIVGALFILLNALGKRLKPSDSYLLILRYATGADDELRPALKRLPDAKIKSKRFTADGQELVLELRLGDEQMARVDAIRTLPSVRELNLVANKNDMQL